MEPKKEAPREKGDFCVQCILRKDRNKHSFIVSHNLQLRPLPYGLYHRQRDGLEFTNG